MATKGKSLIRAANRIGTTTGRLVAAETRRGRGSEPVLCERCGAVFAKRLWRRSAASRPAATSLAAIEWRTCPACEQVANEEWMGRLVVRGRLAPEQDEAIGKRLRNVASRAEFTQPQRRIVSMERSGNVLEVLTTSQKLAHRLGHELEKAFGGRTRYKWSDDGSLEAAWTPEPEPKTKAAARKPAKPAAGRKPATAAKAKAAKPARRPKATAVKKKASPKGRRKR